MGLLKTTGIVTKTTKFSENSLIVTIITKDFGKISAIAQNARTSKSRLIMGLQLFAYSEIVVYESRTKTGLFKLNEMNVIESFGNIRNDLSSLAYASYFAEVVNSVAVEGEKDEEILSLFLNCLFALDKNLCDPEKIKAVFQWRIAAISGYEPMVDVCGSCGNTGSEFLFDIFEGECFCQKCADGRTGLASLSDGMRKTLQYISEADSKKIFSFDAGEKAIVYLSTLGEKYIEAQFDKNFGTLDYLKKVIGLDK
ncbi:MAG: DNA repair protein RecO [Clostridia bacterium]|nr:DNA repair protein RecO [Clostridia bacterium]